METSRYNNLLETPEVLKPLRLGKNRWRSRWLVLLPSWRVLHRVSEATWKNVDDYGGSYVEGTGTMVCGASGKLYMPGLLSRMGLPRCKKCCKALGIPPGDGAPYNDKTLPLKQQSI
jgi:hypothetical protein